MNKLNDIHVDAILLVLVFALVLGALIFARVALADSWPGMDSTATQTSVYPPTATGTRTDTSTATATRTYQQPGTRLIVVPASQLLGGTP